MNNRRGHRLVLLACAVALTTGLMVSSLHAESYLGANIDWEQFSGQHVRMMMNKHWFTDGLQPQVAEFEKNTGVKVVFDIYPEEAFWTKLKVELAGGLPTVDGFMVGSLDMGSYTAAGWLESLNKFFENPKLIDKGWYDFEDLYPSAIRGGTNQGQLLVIPIGTEAELMCYRRDLFAENGITIPRTYEELYEAALKLKTDQVAGYVSRGLRGLSIVWEWTGYLLSHGGRYFDASGMPAFNSPSGVQASDMYGKMLRDTGPAGVISYGWPEVLAGLQQGKVAIGIEASGALPALEAEESTIAGKVGYAQIPAAPGQKVTPNYWFWNLGMNPRSQRKDATFLFLMWATSKPILLRIARGSGVSAARLSVWEDPLFYEAQNKEWIDASVESFSLVEAELVPYLNPKYPEIADVISVELQNIVLGAPVKKSLDEAAKQITEMMSR